MRIDTVSIGTFVFRNRYPEAIYLRLFLGVSRGY